MIRTAAVMIERSKSWLVFNAAFFASIILQLRLVEDESAFTAWTDSVTLGYNPKFVSSLSEMEVHSLLSHEVMHVALLHSFRRNGRDMTVWNDACDYVINRILKTAKYTVPSNWLYDKQYDDMSEEAIYELLMKQRQTNPNPQGTIAQESSGGNGGKQNGEKSAPGEGDSRNGGGPQARDHEAATPEWDKIDGLGVGEVRDYVPQKDVDGQSGDDCSAAQPSTKGYDMSPTDMEQMWKLKIQQAAIMAKMQGSLPGMLERLINSLLEPVIPWRETLARFITESSANDYNWKRPNPRYMSMDLYLPSLYNPTLGTIAVMIDTSGSIQQIELDRFASELRAILTSYPETTIEVIYADSKVSATQTMNIYDLEMTPMGGGGTDYRPAFAYIEEQEINPVCGIYFTDGWCHKFPSYPPDYPVLWIVNGARELKTPFGEVIQVEEVIK